jgi:hypothetical protein
MTQALALLLFASLGIAGLLSAPAAFALVMVMYPLEQVLQASGGIFLAIPSLANAIVAVVASLSVTRLVATTARPFLGALNFQLAGVATLLAWSLLSLLWTPSREDAIELVRAGYAYIVVLVLICPLLVTSLSSLAKLNRAVLYAGTAVAAVMAASPEFRSWSGRLVTTLAGASLSNPLAVGELGGTLIICAVLYRSTARSLQVTFCRIAAFPLGAILTLLSGSRGQLIFAVLVCVLFYPVARRLTSVKNFVGGVLALGIGTALFFVLAPIFVTGYGVTRWDIGNVQGSAIGRLGNFLDLLDAFRSDPVAWVFGLGYNAFSSISTNALDVYAHNLTAEVLMELGIPMFVVYVSMITRATKDGLHLLRQGGDDPDLRASTGLFLALIAYQLLLAQKQGTLWGQSILFMLLVALARLRERERQEESTASSE